MDINKLSTDLLELADAVKDGREKPTDEQCARFAIACLIVGSEVKKYCQAMLAERRTAHTRPTEPTLNTFTAGDHVQWTSRNGKTTRVGKLIEWLPNLHVWFVEFEPDLSLIGGDGFRTWIKASELVKIPGSPR